MKRTALVLVGLLSLAGIGSLSAQQGIRVGIGGGLLMPMGTYKDFDKLGWLVGGDVTYWLTGSPVGIRGDVQYSQTSEKSGVGAHNTKIIGGLAEVVFALGTQADQIRPYLLGGVGYYNVKISNGGASVSESKIGFGGGAGLAFKVGTGSTRVFVEGKFVSVSTTGGSTSFLPIRAGFRFGGK
jgi:opacity protein-like surface antigen